MTTPKLTVVLLTYNRPHTLKLALRSILDQDCDDFGVLVLDNASTDETPDVIRSSKDPRITYVRNEKNIGIIRNWNRGLAMNRSPYVSVFHDDDIMLPGFLRQTVDVLERHPSAAFAFVQAQFIDQQGEPAGVQDMGEIPDGLMRGLDFLELCVDGRGTLIFPPTIVCRASAVAEVWPFESPHTRGYVDINSYNRMAERHDIYFLRKPLVQYRVHTGSDTELLNRESGATPWYGEVSTRIDSIAALLRDPRAADGRYRNWLADRLLYLHQQASAAIHPSVPAMYHAWDTRVEMAEESLESLIPQGASVILLDDAQLGLPAEWRRRRILPFLERNGEYFGPPTDNEQAIAELTRMRSAHGAAWLVVAWPCFWWMERYWRFRRHLDSSFPRRLNTPHVVAYELTDSQTAQR